MSEAAIVSRSEKERSLRPIVIAVSVLMWVVLAVTVIGALYAAFVALFVLLTQALWLAAVTNNSVKVGAKQLPHIWEKVVSSSARLGLAQPPDTYVMQAGGSLNAFATRLFSRNFVILFSDLVDASVDAGNDPAAPSIVDFVVAHEVAHIARDHLAWWLLPARLIPWLGPAYSRACEYTCDENALSVTTSLPTAERALGLLAGGVTVARTMDVDAFADQAQGTGGFFAAVYELNATHPYLPKRVNALRAHGGGKAAPAPSRSFFSYLLAPFLGIAIPGSAAAVVLIIVAMVGIMAAIAVPSFMKYRESSQEIRQRLLDLQAGITAEQKAAEGSDEPDAQAESPDQLQTGVMHGEKFDWTLTAPANLWRVLNIESAHAQNTMADGWISHTEKDAHVMVIAEAAEGITLSAFAENVLANFKQGDSRMKVTSQAPLIFKNGKGRLLHIKTKVAGMNFDYLIGLLVSSDNAYQLIGFVDSKDFGAIKTDMEKAIASFEVEE